MEVRGWSFQLSVRNLHLLFHSVQNLEGKKKERSRSLLQSVKDGARSDQEPENVLIPDVNIQDLHAGKKQKKQQEPSRKKNTLIVFF